MDFEGKAVVMWGVGMGWGEIEKKEEKLLAWATRWIMMPLTKLENTADPDLGGMMTSWVWDMLN